MKKTYDIVLNETHDMFSSQGISILGEGYKEIATNPSLFNSYKEALLMESTANDAAMMSQIMDNTNNHILTESSLAGITPVASLSMPVIRKLWPKFGLKEAVKEEVAKSPRFVVSYTKPYLFRANADGAEERVYLPRAMNTTPSVGKNMKITRVVKLTDAAPTASIDFGVDADAAQTITVGDANVAGEGTVVLSTGSNIKRQPLNTDMKITLFSLGGVVDTATENGLDISKNIVLDIDENVTVLVRFDLQNGTAKVAAMGLTDSQSLDLLIAGTVSPEYNEGTWSISYDIDRTDIAIGAGVHLNSPLPVEALQDMMALYQIDGTKETVDLMTNFFAQRLDLDVLDELDSAVLNAPTQYVNDIPSFGSWEFDAIPSVGYAQGPKAWREELKTLIDQVASTIKNNTYLTTGTFVLIANPLDANLIQNIDWQFRGGDGSISAVAVDYSIGTYASGVAVYKVISSPNVTQGKILINFIPEGNKQMTTKYYPYSFSTELGYQDPNRSRTPSIMMTKRHTFKTFLAACASITIKNNTGMPYREYMPTKDWTE